MPGTGGRELMEWVRDSGIHTKVLVLSGGIIDRNRELLKLLKRSFFETIWPCRSCEAIEDTGHMNAPKDVGSFGPDGSTRLPGKSYEDGEQYLAGNLVSAFRFEHQCHVIATTIHHEMTYR